MLHIPLAFLLERSTTIGTTSLLHTEAMDNESSSKDARDGPSDSFRLEHSAADAQIAEACTERRVGLDPVLAWVVRVSYAAADARTAGLDAPGTTTVPTHDTAVRLGLRTTATHGIQAVAHCLFRSAECINEFAILEVTATLAVVMDGLIEDDLRLVLVREFRQLTNEQNIDENRRSPFRVSRATGNVNDRSVDAALLGLLLNAECVQKDSDRLPSSHLLAQRSGQQQR